MGCDVTRQIVEKTFCRTSQTAYSDSTISRLHQFTNRHSGSFVLYIVNVVMKFLKHSYRVEPNPGFKVS